MEGFIEVIMNWYVKMFINPICNSLINLGCAPLIAGVLGFILYFAPVITVAILICIAYNNFEFKRNCTYKPEDVAVRKLNKNEYKLFLKFTTRPMINIPRGRVKKIRKQMLRSARISDAYITNSYMKNKTVGRVIAFAMCKLDDGQEHELYPYCPTANVPVKGEIPCNIYWLRDKEGFYYCGLVLAKQTKLTDGCATNR